MTPGLGATVWTPEQRRVTLAKLIKSGGAGSVYLLGDGKGQVAKIYHPGAGLDDYRRKIAAMLTLSPTLPDIDENGHHYVQIAWPQSALLDGNGNFVGFLMPTLDVAASIELEYMLQERQALAAGLPTGLGAKITLAANLCAVIVELHRHGHYVVDLKPVNLRFYRTSLYMAMLDCDGFSIQGQGERFPATQFTPDYLAPEFQSRGIPADGEEAQDRFALAVVVFQLLNFGIHPYTGRPQSDRVPTDIPSRIAGRYYAYGLQPNASLAPSPVSGHRCFPAELRALFDRAFAGSTATRPAASEWLIALRGYAQRSRQQLVVCAVDPAHQHFVGLPCAACTRAALVTQTAKRQAAVRAAAPIPVVGVRQTIGWRMTRPVAPAGVRPRRGWPTPGTTTNFPLPLPTSFATGPSPKPVFNWIKVALYVVLLLFVVFNKTHKPTPTPDSHPTQSQQAAAPDADNPNFNPENRACFHAGNPLESGPGRLASVAASSAVSRQNQPLKLAFYSLMQSATGTSGPTVPPSQRARFTQYVDSQLYDDFNTRELLINSTENDLHDQNRDAETAYERGWLALADRQPDVAIESFVCAIEIDPRLPESWYGLAVASEDPMLATGFMTISNLLAPGDAYRQAVRAQFNPRLLDRIYRDHDSMATIDTNAEGHAQRIRADRVVLPMSPSAASR